MRRLSIISAAVLPLMLTIAYNSFDNKGKAQFERRSDVASAVADSTATISPEREDEQAPSPNGNTPAKVAQNSPATVVNPDWDKKIIKTADLSIETKNFQSFTNRLHDIVKQQGGYIAQEQQTQSFSSIENTVSIKVPVGAFDGLLQQLATDSDRLVEKKVSSEDVTGKIVDTRSRLETKKEIRERYLDLLKQARNMKDILAVQGEINNLQEEMDAAAGQIAWMGHSAAFSKVIFRT